MQNMHCPLCWWHFTSESHHAWSALRRQRVSGPRRHLCVAQENQLGHLVSSMCFDCQWFGMYHVHTLHMHVHTSTVYMHVHTLYIGTTDYLRIPLLCMPVCTALVMCMYYAIVYQLWSLISNEPHAVKHEGFRHCSGVVVARRVGWCRLKFDSFNI